MMGNALSVRNSGEGYSNEWYTPPAVFEALGLRFDMDVSGPPGGVPWVPAERTLSREDDGLRAPWKGRVWMNPPYDKGALTPWMQRFVAHGHGIALVFARTDTRWWHNSVPGADAVCFMRGRLTFLPGPGAPPTVSNSGAPSALIAYGADCADAVVASGLGLTYGKALGDGS